MSFRISPEMSLAFYHLNLIPLYPKVREHFEDNGSVGPEVVSRSLDLAVKWFYDDLVFDRLPFDLKGEASSEKLSDWINDGTHDYFDVSGGRVRTLDVARDFPFGGVSYNREGIMLGQVPVVIDLQKSGLFWPSVKEQSAIGEDVFVAEYGLENMGAVLYETQGRWSVKDLVDAKKLFAAHFSSCYTNEILNKYDFC